MSSTQLNLSQNQSVSIPAGLKHEFVVVASQSAPSWGSNFIVRLTEKGFIHECVLAFNVNAISGYTDPSGITVTNQVPRLNSTPFWIQKIDICQSSEVIQTIYPDAAFLRQQLFTKEDDRLPENASQGIYSSTSNRRTMSIANSNWYLPLKTVFNESLLPILTEQQSVEIRIWLNPLANLVTTTGLTVTTLQAQINSCSAIVKMTKLPAPELAKEIQAFQTKPKHYRFFESRYVNGTAQAGTSSYSLPLTNIVGKVANIFFIVRPTASMSQDNVFSYTDIASFAILDGGSTNIVGGQDITSLYNRTVQSKHWNRSFYLMDAFNGTSNAYVFQYSFSLTPFDSINNGKSQSFRQFQGTEILKINFNSALASTYDITCYAQTMSYCEQSKQGIRKLYA
jgi:hypothetical protein